ncbi:MAG TPA: NADH-quinone oxidoreductase subunit L [Planctomycetota bacterium]|nr:NADH-quinone oxidoreductase subunit L [Planctomycetota bacterium]
MSGWLWLIPALPLAGFLINGLLKLPRAGAALVGCAGPAGALVLSVMAALCGPAEERLFEWIGAGTLSIPFGLRVDALSAVMILVVTGVGTLIHLYSVEYMREDEGFSRYFAYLNLFMFSMLVLVLADSAVLMFLGWEGVGLCSYLLIGFWYRDLGNADAGKKAFITNRVGDVGFLLGLFCLWQIYGTLEFAGMASRPAPEGAWAVAAGYLLFLGATGKSAQIPLYVWLPDAMAGPTPVSALIHAATMVTAGVYMMGRMHFLYAAVPGVLETVAAVAAATALLAAVIATVQNDIKKVLAYSTISQLGFMFAGAAAAHFTAGLFHVVTHAFFKALLFLGAGAVIHALHGEQDIRRMGGLARTLKLTFVCFLIGGLALAGMPGTAGFFSKDLVLEAVMARGWSGVALVLAATAALTAFYTARLVIAVFLARPAQEHSDLHAPGPWMTAPLALLAAASLAGGAILKEPLAEFLAGVWGRPAEVPGLHARAMTWSIVAFGLGTLGAALAFGPLRERARAWAEGPLAGLRKLAERKFYVDELYEFLVVAPVRTGAVVAWYLVDRLLIDGLLVHGTGRLVAAVGTVLRRSHGGSINGALAVFVLGAAAILGYLIWRFGP